MKTGQECVLHTWKSIQMLSGYKSLLWLHLHVHEFPPKCSYSLFRKMFELSLHPSGWHRTTTMSGLSPSIFSCSHCAAFRLRQIEATAIQHTFICLTLFSQTDNSEANDWFLWLFVGRWTLVTLDWSVLFPEKSGFLQEQAQGLILEVWFWTPGTASHQVFLL